MHLAFLVHTLTLAFFGLTCPSDAFHTAPTSGSWGGDHLACRPCYDGRSYAPCPSNVCLQSVSTEDVVAVAVKILAEYAAPLAG